MGEFERSSRRRIRGIRAVLLTAALAVAGVAVGLVLGELLLRALLPTSTTYLALTPGRRAVFNPQHQPGVEGPSLYEVNSTGVRAREWADDRESEYRILAVGGSTTEGLINDQQRVWTALLERELEALDGRRVWVGNIGKSGLNSRHHVLQLRHLLAVYDPEKVLLLVGVNDLSVRLGRDEDYDPRYAEDAENRRRLEERAFEVIPGNLPGAHWREDPWYKRTRLWRLVRVLKYQVLEIPEAQDLEGRSTQTWRDLRAAGKRRDRLPPLEEALNEYARNLEEIARLAAGHGAELTLMTQPVLWRDDLTPDEESLLWMGGVGDFRARPGSTYYTPAAMARGMDAYNAQLLEVCERIGADCFDLAAEIPKTTEYFWDDCHFTDRGQAAVAEAIARFIRDR